MTVNDCIFCQIVAKTAPSHLVYEDDGHIAFLSIYPPIPATTVVIPKKHYQSDWGLVPGPVLADLIAVAQTVSRGLVSALDDCDRTVLVVEGLMINHIHFVLSPIGPGNRNWHRPSPKTAADGASLATLATKIRGGF